MVPEEGWEVLSWTRMEMKALSPGVSPKSAADPSTSSVTPSSLPWVYKSLLRSGALWHLQCSSVTDASSLPNYLFPHAQQYAGTGGGPKIQESNRVFTLIAL